MPWVCTCGQSNNDEEYPCSSCNRFVDDEPDAVIAPVGRRFKAPAPVAHAAPTHQAPALFDQEEDDDSEEESAPVGRRFKTASATSAPSSVVMPAAPLVNSEEKALADRRALVARLAEEGRAEEARKKEEARKALLARLNAEAEANERVRAENARLQEARRIAEEKAAAAEAAREAEAARAEQARVEQARVEQARVEQARVEQERAEQARAEERTATAHRLAEESSVAHPDANLDWLEDDAWFTTDDAGEADAEANTEVESPEVEEAPDNRAWFFERLAANADSVHIEPEPMVEKLDRVKLSEAWNEHEGDQEEDEDAFDWFATSVTDDEENDEPEEAVEDDPIEEVVDPYGLQFADWAAEDYERHDDEEGANDKVEVEAEEESSAAVNWWEEDEDDVPPAPASATKGRVSPKPVAWNEFNDSVDLDSPDESEIEPKKVKAKSAAKKKRPTPSNRQPVKVEAPFFAGLFQQHSRVVMIAALVVVIGLLGTMINGVFNRASAEGELASGTTCALGGSGAGHDEDDFASLFGSNIKGLDAIPDYSSNGGPIDFSQALQREPDLGGALALLESTRFMSGFSRTFEGSGNTMAATIYEFANPICADDYLKAQVPPGPTFSVPFGVSSVGYAETQGDKTLYVVRTVQGNTLLTTAFIGGNAETGPRSSIDVAWAIAERMSGGEDSGVVA